MRVRHALLVLVLLGAAALTACGGSDDAASTTTLQLSADAREGQQVAETEGCTSCHRVSGDEGIGPSWEGLAGSEVELADGTTVVADDEYLRRSILEPNAQVVKGYSGIMPERTLDDEQVTALVAYLNALGGVGN